VVPGDVSGELDASAKAVDIEAGGTAIFAAARGARFVAIAPVEKLRSFSGRPLKVLRTIDDLSRLSKALKIKRNAMSRLNCPFGKTVGP